MPPLDPREARGLIASFLLLAPTIVACILWFDPAIAYWAKNDLPRPVFDFFKAITEIGDGTWWYVGTVAVLAAALWRRSRKWRDAAILMLASMTLSGLTVPLLKLAFGRLRPRFLFELGQYGFEPFHTLRLANLTFPSGHSQTIFAATVALGFVFPRWRWPLLCLALLVALSRPLTSVHFASDMLAGSWIGIAGAILVHAWLRARTRHPAGYLALTARMKKFGAPPIF